MKKTTYLTQEQRQTITEQCEFWFEEWKLNDSLAYPESWQERLSMFTHLNNSDFLKHVYKYYAHDIWEYL
tara:strand:- start:182 stop:391 length:210 start_codon:yes stop_codon:yes gene_type:complete